MGNTGHEREGLRLESRGEVEITFAVAQWSKECSCCLEKPKLRGEDEESRGFIPLWRAVLLKAMFRTPITKNSSPSLHYAKQSHGIFPLAV